MPPAQVIDMKHIIKKTLALILAAFSVLSIFGGCSNEDVQNKENYDYSKDCQLVNSYYADSNIAKCETGYYVSISTNIYYVEGETMQATPLCNKPNCMHNDDSCNSNIGVVDNISYYDGSIYFVESADDEYNFEGFNLIRMSADGSQKENVFHMDLAPYDWIIHRGVFYYVVRKYSVDENTGMENINDIDCYIYSYSLDKSSSEQKEIYFAEEVQRDAQISELMAYGDNLFFELYGMKRDNKTVEIRKTLKMNLSDYSVTEMLSPAGTGNYLSTPMYLDEMLIFSSGDEENGKYIYYKTDFDGNNPEKFFESYEGENIICDGKYMYVDNYMALNVQWIATNDEPVNRKERYITVYDSKLNKVDEFSLGDGSAKTWFLLPVDDEVFLFGGKNDNGNFIFYYDKSELGSLNGKLWEKTFCLNPESQTKSSNSNKTGAISETPPSGSEELVNMWQKAKDKDYGVKDSFQSEGADAEAGFSVKLSWEQDGGTVTSYFPFMEFESEDKAKEFMSEYPYALRSGKFLVLVGVESVPEEVHSMLVSILDGEPIEPIDGAQFSGEFFSFKGQ